MTGAFVSTACLRQPADLMGRVRLLLEHDLRRIELGSALPCSAEDLAALAGTGAEFLVHNYFPAPPLPFVLDLASSDPAVLTASREFCQRAVDLSASFGAPFYSVHAGFRAAVHPGDLGGPLRTGAVAPYEEAYGRFVESLIALCTYAAGRGVGVAVEPHVVADFNLVDGRNQLLLMCEAAELRRALADVALDNLGVLVDVGHLNVTATTLGFDRVRFVEDLADRVLAFHLHDNDGRVDQHRPFDSRAWFLPLVARFPAVPRILECHVRHPEELRRLAELVAPGASR